MATIPEAAVIEAAAAISKQLTDSLPPGDRARRWQQQAGEYRSAARAGLLAALPHMQSSGLGRIHERLLYGVRLGSLGSYGFAAGAACLAMAARWALGTAADHIPYLPFIPAVTLAAFYCGTGPGLVTVLLGGLFTWLFFIPPDMAWNVAHLAQGRGLIAYLIVAGLLSAMVGALRRALDSQRQAEMRQAILIGELQQRTRNLLSVVRLLSERTASDSVSLDEFGERYADRLAAIGRAQNLVWADDPIDLLELVRTELSAHGADRGDARIRVRGPALHIARRPTRLLALAIHELATNSLKYGALSQAQAGLDIGWDHDPGAGRLVFEWTEHHVRIQRDKGAGGGFGRQLIEDALPYELMSTTEFELTRDGMRCRILIPTSCPA